MKNFLNFLIFCCVLLIISQRQLEAGFVITAEAPKVETTSVTGVTTESFNSSSTGFHTSLTTAVGSISATGTGLQILAADQYGGVGATGNYMNIGRTGGTSMTLTLSGPVAYFGFEWEAADSGNAIQFYLQGALVASFSSAGALGNLSSSYLGNPDTGQDSGEKFAYLNFFGTSGTTFDKIVFSNVGSTGFESDNWSIRTAEVPPPYPGTVLINSISVAEPSSMLLATIGLAGFVIHTARQRCRNFPSIES